MVDFPTTLDSFTDVTCGDSRLPKDVFNEIYDGLEALEAKVGTNSSAVTSSLDYQLNNTSSSNPGHKHTLVDGATDVTATASELNQLDGVSVGGTSSGDIVTIDGSQTLSNKLYQSDNNDGYQQEDSGGTVRNVANVNASNILEIAGTGIAGILLNLNNISFAQDDSGGDPQDVFKVNSSDVLEIGDTDLGIKFNSKTSHLGSFTVSGNGTINVTGVGFEPKMIIFLTPLTTTPSVGSSINSALGLGIAQSTSNRFLYSTANRNGNGGAVYFSASHSIGCTTVAAGGGSQNLTFLGDVTTFGTDGFTVTITSYATGSDVFYLALSV